jgi:hypothetical protein
MSTKAIENDLYSSDLFSSDQSLNQKEISSNLQGRNHFICMNVREIGHEFSYFDVSKVSSIESNELVREREKKPQHCTQEEL